MAEDKKRISDLAELELGAITGNELLPVGSMGKGKKVKLSTIKSYIGSAGGGGSVDLTKVDSNIIPRRTEMYSIGNGGNRFADAHFSGWLYLGSSIISGTADANEEAQLKVDSKIIAIGKNGEYSRVLTDADMGVFALKSELNTTNAELELTNNELTRLQVSFGSALGDIIRLGTDVSGLKSNMILLDEEVDTLGDRVAIFEESYIHKDSFQSWTGRIEQNEKAISDLVDYNEGFNTEFNDVINSLNTLKADKSALSNYYTKSEIHTVAISGDYNDLINTPEIPSFDDVLKTNDSAHIGTGLEWSSSQLRVEGDIINNASDGHTAYSWGNHAEAGYATDSSVTQKIGSLLTEIGSKQDKLSFGDEFSLTQGTGLWNVELKLSTGLAVDEEDGLYVNFNGYATKDWVNSQAFTIAGQTIKFGNNISADTFKSSLGLHTVATSGSYNDLTNKPSIPNIDTLINDGLATRYDVAEVNARFADYLPLSASDTFFKNDCSMIFADYDLASLKAGAYWVMEDKGAANPVPLTYSSFVVLGNAYYSLHLSAYHDASRAFLRGIYNTSPAVAGEWHELAFIDSNVASAGGLSSKTPQLAAKTESNEITVVDNANSAITTNKPSSTLSSIRKAIDFRWFNEHWQIGAIRGDGEWTEGFGITFGNDNLVFSVDKSGHAVFGGNLNAKNARLQDVFILSHKDSSSNNYVGQFDWENNCLRIQPRIEGVTYDVPVSICSHGGNVGIGTTTPAPSTKLHVEGTIRTSELSLSDGNNVANIRYAYGTGVIDVDKPIDAIDLKVQGKNVATQEWTISYVAANSGGSGEVVYADPYYKNGIKFSSTLREVEADEDWFNNRYLKLSGGAVSGGLSVAGNLVTADTIVNKSHFFFARGNANADWIVTDENWHHEYTLIHSGNIGSQAVARADFADAINLQFSSNINDAVENSFFSGGFQADNRPNGGVNYCTGFTIKNGAVGYLHQLSFDTFDSLFTRVKKSDGWSAWRAVAFVDSTVANANSLGGIAASLYATTAWVEEQGYAIASNYYDKTNLNNMLTVIGGAVDAKADKTYVDNNFVTNKMSNSFVTFSTNLQIANGTITINGVNLTPITEHQTIYPLTLKTQNGDIIYRPNEELSGTGYEFVINKESVGLDNVENKSSATIRGEISKQNVIDALKFTPYDASNPNNYTSNAGTITGIKMNGSSMGTSGEVDLGNVVTGAVAPLYVGSGSISIRIGTGLMSYNDTAIGDICIGVDAAALASNVLSGYALKSSLDDYLPLSASDTFFKNDCSMIFADYDLASLKAGAYWVMEDKGAANPVPLTYSSFVVLGNAYYSLHLSAYHDASRAFLRGIYNTSPAVAGEWHELAFIDSTVAAANKLVTSGGTDAVYVNSSGNVTIGGSDLAGSSVKLYVDGSAEINGGVRIKSPSGLKHAIFSVDDSLYTLSLSTSLNITDGGDLMVNGKSVATQTWVGARGYIVGKTGSDAHTYVKLSGGIESEDSWALRIGTDYFSSGVGTQYAVYANYGNGNVHLGTPNYRWNNVYAVTVNQSSDATHKNVLGDIGLTTSQIANAPAVNFTWKHNGKKDVGTIAQYWKDVLPEVVSGEEGSMGMNYATLGVVSAIVLARSVETHEQRIARLEREISELQDELDALVKYKKE